MTRSGWVYPLGGGPCESSPDPCRLFPLLIIVAQFHVPGPVNKLKLSTPLLDRQLASPRKALWALLGPEEETFSIEL